MTTRIGKVFRFEAAHHLPDHDGKCRQPHGHSYRVELSFVGEPQADGPKRGMVVDFGDIASAWDVLRGSLDHRDLNETPGLDVTTAEAIARWIFEHMEGEFEGLDCVRVWETAGSWAEYPA